MLSALSGQPLPALILHALARGVLYTLLIQLIALLSGLTTSGPIQMLILVIVFGLMVFSVDVIEKYVARARLSRR